MTESSPESTPVGAQETPQTLLAPLSPLEGLVPLGDDEAGLCSGGVCRLPAPVETAP